MGLQSRSRGFVELMDLKGKRKMRASVGRKFLVLFSIILLVSATAIVVDLSKPAPQVKMVRAINAKVGIIASSETSATYGGGAYPLDAIAAARMFEWMGAEVEFVDLDDIIQGRLSSENFDILYFGGGSAYFWKTEDQNDGFTQYIRDYVSNGGNYIGVCAGSYFAADYITWEGSAYEYPLKLFDGWANGSISDISDYPDPWALTTVRIVDSDFPDFNGQQFTVMYYWGPYFEKYADSTQDVDVVAVYDYGGQADEKPAMIKFPYGNGKVFLSGVHPEFEENASIEEDRDWSYADDFDGDGNPMIDPDTEWPLIEEIVEWMLPDKVGYVEKVDAGRDAPPATPYRAAVYAGVGASTRTVYATMKMLDYLGVQPYGWDEYARKNITIDTFDLVVFPNGNGEIMDTENRWVDYIDEATIDQFVADGGDIIGIGGGAELVWSELGYSVSELSANTSPPLSDGLNGVTITNSGDYNGDYQVAYWYDGSGGSSAADWDTDVTYDPISWTDNGGGSQYLVGYLSSDSSQYVMIKYTNPKGDGTNAQVFLTTVDPSTEETTTTNRDAAIWDNDDFNDPDSEWDFMGSILEWMGFTVTVPELGHSVVVMVFTIFLGVFVFLRRREDSP